MKEVEVKGFGGFTTSITTLWGKTPKINMMCGKCEYVFSKRFHTFECIEQYPRTKCPDCSTTNFVPIIKT